MSVEFRTLQPEEFYRQHLTAGVRPDGRGLLERRPVTVCRGHINTADGSAVVKAGGTTVVCGVRAEVASPSSDQPGHGFIVPNFSFAHSSMMGGSLASHYCQRLTQFLLTVLTSSKCLHLTDLCIVPGKHVWALYIDVICLDNSGNVPDASVLALISALEDVRLPGTSYDEETDQLTVSQERSSLKVHSRPACSSVLVFNNPDSPDSPHLVSDPTRQEEAVSSGTVSLVTVGDQICHLHQPGGTSLSPSLLQQTVNIALQRKQTTTDKIFS